MIELLPCRWRSGQEHGLWCHSPRYIAPPNRVTAEFCRACCYREPEPVGSSMAAIAEWQAPCELRKYERRIHSQNGEDGIIAEILRRTQTQGLAVELGAHFEYGNCYRLAELGHPTLFIECDADRLQRLAARINGPLVSYKLVHVTVENANLAVPADTMILSIDIDGNDYWIWQALKCRPDVAIIEFNLVHPPPERKVVPYDPKFCWDGTDYYGASLSALYELGRRMGYVLVATDSVQCNAYFVLERFADRFVPVTPEQVWFTPTWRHAVSVRKMVDLP
jgi:hypothetical protein